MKNAYRKKVIASILTAALVMTSLATIGTPAPAKAADYTYPNAAKIINDFKKFPEQKERITDTNAKSVIYYVDENNNKKRIDKNFKYPIKVLNDRTALAIRDLEGVIKIGIEWDNANRLVVVNNKAENSKVKEIVYPIDRRAFAKDGQAGALDTSATIHAAYSRTYLPVRSVAETIGYQIDFVKQDGSVWVGDERADLKKVVEDHIKELQNNKPQPQPNQLAKPQGQNTPGLQGIVEWIPINPNKAYDWVEAENIIASNAIYMQLNKAYRYENGNYILRCEFSPIEFDLPKENTMTMVNRIRYFVDGSIINSVLYEGKRQKNLSWYDDNTKKLHLVFECKLNPDEYAKTMEENEFAREWVKNNIRPGMSDREKIRSVVSWVSENTTYATDDKIGIAAYNAYDVFFNHQSACVGYSSATAKLLTEAGIKARRITANIHEPDGSVVGHAFNVVYLDGRWTYLDSLEYPGNYLFNKLNANVVLD